MDSVIDASRSNAVRRGRNLEYATIGWNSLEAVAAIGAGASAGSIALVGFGFDSVSDKICALSCRTSTLTRHTKESFCIELSYCNELS